MRNQKVVFIVCVFALLVCPFLLYAQTSYEDTLKKKMENPLKIIEKNRQLVGEKNNWWFYRGNWDVTGETIKYLGSEPSVGYGAALHKTQRLWNGYIETSITFTEKFIRDKQGFYIMLSYNPVSGNRYYVGFGGTKGDTRIAYSLWDIEIEEDGDVNENQLAYSGAWEDLLVDFEYKLRIVIRGRQLDFIINGVKVFTSKLPHNMYSDFVGIKVYGTNPIEFKYFRIKEEDPFDLIQQRLARSKK